MKGNPKYNYGDIVKFQYDPKTTIYEGSIYIIDPYGTFENPSDVSYDIMVEHDPSYDNKPCLHKHVTESLILCENF